MGKNSVVYKHQSTSYTQSNNSTDGARSQMHSYTVEFNSFRFFQNFIVNKVAYFAQLRPCQSKVARSLT